MNARPARSTSREVLATGPYPVGAENVDRGRGCAWGAQTRRAYRSVDLQEDRISAPHALLPSLARTAQELIAANGATSTIESLGTLLGPLGAGVLVAFADVASVF